MPDTTTPPKVPLGASEAASALVAIAGLIALFFGKNLKLDGAAQTIGPLISTISIAAMTFARAYKHHSLNTALLGSTVTNVVNQVQEAVPALLSVVHEFKIDGNGAVVPKTESNTAMSPPVTFGSVQDAQPVQAQPAAAAGASPPAV
jgi:hypothetical protein